MPICPQGHDSPTDDYCDYCGWPMSAPGQQSQQSPQQPQQPQQPYQQHPPSTTGLVMCPICSTPQTERYCEECGFDYDLASPSRRVQPPAPAPAPAAPQPPQHQHQQPQHQQQAQQQQQQQPQQPQPPAYGYPIPQPPSQSLSQQQAQQQPYQQQPPQQQGYQPQQQHQPQQQAPQQPQAPQQQAPQPSPPYGVPAGTYGGVSYSTGETSGGFSTDFMLQPPVSGADPMLNQPQQPQSPGRGTWVAVVAADRAYFDDMMARSGPDAAGLYFPPYTPERRVPMTGRGQLRIGRRSHQRGTVPEIDLSIAPEDPGASHQHALLQEQPDGGWVVIDQDSTNGTTLNGAPDPLDAHQPIQLQDGDRIHIGAWTTVTVHRS